jgi:hypothetical protein
MSPFGQSPRCQAPAALAAAVRPLFASLLCGLALLAALSGGAGADETTPCPADQPRPALSIRDHAGRDSLYATHLLQAGVEPPSTGSAVARSFTAPGARIFTEDGETRPTLVSDTPGPLTLTAVVVIRDRGRLPASDDYSCTTTVTTTVGLQSPQPSVFGDFERPRRLGVPGRKLYPREPNFSFTVKVAKLGADMSPFTVRARGAGRLELPRPGAKAASYDYPLRDFELAGWNESVGYQFGGRVRRCELICSPVNRWGFSKRVAVWADRLDGRRGGVEVTVVPPTGLPDLVGGKYRRTPTPFGVDVEVLQSARRVARLRIAARCDLGGKGQATTCRFKTIDTRL